MQSAECARAIRFLFFQIRQYVVFINTYTFSSPRLIVVSARLIAVTLSLVVMSGRSLVVLDLFLYRSFARLSCQAAWLLCQAALLWCQPANTYLANCHIYNFLLEEGKPLERLCKVPKVTFLNNFKPKSKSSTKSPLYKSN